MSSTSRSDDSVRALVADVVLAPVSVPRVIILDSDAEGWRPSAQSIRQRGLRALVSGQNDSAIDLVTACEAEVAVRLPVAASSPSCIGRMRSDGMARTNLSA